MGQSLIIGIGNDIVEIERVRHIMAGKHGERFLRRVLTEAERRLCEQRQGKQYEFTAGRFAAKEAVVKALGCGIGAQIGFRDIEILPDRYGKPICSLSAAAEGRLSLAERKIRIHISISHSQSLASAVAVAETYDSHA